MQHNRDHDGDNGKQFLTGIKIISPAIGVAVIGHASLGGCFVVVVSGHPLAITNSKRNLIWVFPYLQFKPPKAVLSIFCWGSLLREPRGLLERRRWEKAGPSELLPADIRQISS